MSKDEYIKILKSLGIAVKEGIINDENRDVYPRIVVWDYVWEDITASSETYNTSCTYQTSFFSNIPRDPKLLELKQILNNEGLHPAIYHEYVESERYFHSYFSIDLLEKI